MKNEDLPTILFIPSEWVERAMQLHVRTGEAVCLVFFETQIDRRAHERQQINAIMERGVNRRLCHA